MLPLFLLLTGGRRDAEPLIRALDWHAESQRRESDDEFVGTLTIIILLAVAIVSIFALATCADTTKAPNQIAYRENPTGALNGADESTCVAHYSADPAGIWHDCNGERRRTWRSVVLHEGGHTRREFQEIQAPSK